MNRKVYGEDAAVSLFDQCLAALKDGIRNLGPEDTFHCVVLRDDEEDAYHYGWVTSESKGAIGMCLLDAGIGHINEDMTTDKLFIQYLIGVYGSELVNHYNDFVLKTREEVDGEV